MLNIRELLNGKPVKVRYVNRFSTCRVMIKETVAEHSFFVAFYALCIVEWCNKLQKKKINVSLVLKKALLHDIDEAATGDIPRQFKYFDEELKKVLDEVARKGCRIIFDAMWPGNWYNMAVEFLELWQSSKDDTQEGAIVEFADFLSVLSYSYEEIRSSNWVMKENLDAMREYSDKFNDEKYSFLMPLIKQARRILFEEVFKNEDQQS